MANVMLSVGLVLVVLGLFLVPLPGPGLLLLVPGAAVLIVGGFLRVGTGGERTDPEP